MDKSLREKLAKAIVRSGTGREGVRVSLHYQPRLNIRSRSERRKQLLEEFGRIAELLAGESAEVDLASLSVSGQTVEATLPLGRYIEIVEDLAQRDIRVDPLIDRQIVPE